MEIKRITNSEKVDYKQQSNKQKNYQQQSLTIDKQSPADPDFYGSYHNISFKGRSLDNTNFRADLENRAKISTTTLKTFKNMKPEKRFGVWEWTCNGTDEELKLYKTNHHEYVQSSDGSKIYKVKYVEDKDRITQLVLASKLYQSVGVRTPEYIPFEKDNKTGYLVEILEEKLEPQETNKDALYFSFVADAWLGNRNGLSKGNTMIDKDGNPVKLSVAGSLAYRASGRQKDEPFTSDVTELQSMRDYAKNADAAKALHSMSEDDLFRAVEKFNTKCNRSKYHDITGWTFETKNQYYPQNCNDTLCHIIENRAYKIYNSNAEEKADRNKRTMQNRGFYDGKTSAQATNMGKISKDEYILQITDKQWQKLKERNLLQKRYDLKQLSDLDYTYIAKMSDEEHSRALKRHLYEPYPFEEKKMYDKIGGHEIAGLSEISDEDWQVVEERKLLDLKIKHNISEFWLDDFVKAAVKVGPYEWTELLYTGFLDKHIKITDMNNFIKDLQEENLKGNLQPDYEKRMKLLCGLEKDVNYLDIKWKPEYLLEFAKITNEQWERLSELTKNFTDNSIHPQTLANLCNFDKETFEILKKRGLINQNTNAYGLEQIAVLSDEDWANVQKRGIKDLFPHDYKSWAYLATLTDEEFDIAKKQNLFEKRSENGMHNVLDGEEIAQLVTAMTPEDWKNFEKRGLFNQFYTFNGWGYGHPGAHLSTVLSKYSDNEFEKFKAITNNAPNYIYPETVCELIKLPEEAYQRIFDRNLYKYMNRYEAYDNWLEDAPVISGLAQLNDKEYKAFEKQTNDCNTIAAKILIIEAEQLGLDKKHSITELNSKEKKEYLKLMINKGGILIGKDFRHNFHSTEIVPKDINEYTEIMKKLVKSTGMYTKPLDEETKTDFFKAIDKISTLPNEFIRLNLRNPDFKLALKYSRQDFIRDIENLVSNLDNTERLKIWDYFGFEVTSTPTAQRTMFGYPTLHNNEEKLHEIENDETKSVIEKIKPLVEKFTEENAVLADEKMVSSEMADTLNSILKAMPELYTIIGKKQHRTHDYTVDVHTLAVLQECILNPEFSRLTKQEQQTAILSVLLHDITKEENNIDKSHPENSAYDAFFLLEKFNLPKSQHHDIYQLIKNHDMLEKCNKGPYNPATGHYLPISEDEQNKRIQRYAYEYRSGNISKIANIFTQADLLSVDRAGNFFDYFKNAYYKVSTKLEQEVKNIQKTAILLPQTRIPSAKNIKTDGINVIETTTYDEKGEPIKNKVVKLSKDLDLSKYGFDKGVTGRNFNVLVHAFDNELSSVVLSALELSKQDALLSSSYVIYDKGNYHVFRNYGVIKDVPSDNIGAAYYRDFGSGCKKTEQELIDSYINGGNSQYRQYISRLIKKELGLNDDEYIKLYNELKDKPLNVIEQENPKATEALKNIFTNMEIHKRKFNRNYNEVLIGGKSGSGKDTAVFYQGTVDGKPVTLEDVPAYLRKYAQDNDLPIIYFGE